MAQPQYVYDAARYEAARQCSGDVDALRAALDGACGETDLALEMACTYGHTDCVDMLIMHGVDLNTCTPDRSLKNIWRDTPLIIAAENGHVAVVELLLQSGADVNCVNERGESAIMWACGREECEEEGEVVRILLNYGAVLCTEQLYYMLSAPAQRTDHKKRGTSALMAAVMTGNTAIVDMLLAANACVHDRDRAGCSVLHFAEYNGRSTHILEMLLDSGADIDATDDTGETSLLKATMSHNTAKMQMLISHGANVNIRSNARMSCLSILAESCTEQLITSCLEAGADRDLCGEDGNTPIFIAIEHETCNAVRALIRGNCRLDITGCSTLTHTVMSLFYLAMWVDNSSIMEALYQAGACSNDILLECANCGTLKQRCSDSPVIFEQLQKYMSQPSSLQRSCRQVIRSCISTPSTATLASLGLPTILRDYLLFADIRLD